MKILDPEVRAKILALFNQGLSDHEIAKRCGVSHSTAWKVAVDAGLRLPKGYADIFRRLDTVRDLIQEGMNSGASTDRMADDFDVSESALCAYIRRHKIKRVQVYQVNLHERERRALKVARLTYQLFHLPLNRSMAA